MRQELATIHTLEYPIHKGRDGKERGAWPILHCHPHSRGPFVEFDERERRRWEKTRRGEEDQEIERRQRAATELPRKKQAQLLARKTGDLRRSVSMNNLHRQFANAGAEEFVDLDADFPGTQASANASGYLASTSAYIAASGNSVGITSTTGTTSAGGGALRALDLPANLHGRIQQQVVTSRKVSALATGRVNSNRQPNAMGPPDSIPDHPKALLRKSRSTNTLRLPKRDEGCKPGYCESCRVKFEDFEYVSLFFVSTFETVAIVSLPRTTPIIFSWTLFSTVFNAVLWNNTKNKSLNIRLKVSSRRIPRMIWTLQCVLRLHSLSKETKMMTRGVVVIWMPMKALFWTSEEAF